MIDIDKNMEDINNAKAFVSIEHENFSMVSSMRLGKND